MSKSFLYCLSCCVSLFLSYSGAVLSQSADTLLAKRYQKKGETFMTAAKYDSALANISKAYTIFKAADRPVKYVYLKLYKARILEDKGERDAAFQLAKEVLADCKTLLKNDAYPTSSANSELGLMYYRRGEMGLANYHIEHAVEIEQRKGVPTSDLASYIVNQANLQVSYGHFQDGISSYKKALDIYEKLGLKEGSLLSRIYGNLGNVYQKIGDNKRAESMQLKGLDIKIKRLPPNHPSIAISLLNLANSQKGIGNLAVANENLEKARKIFARNPAANQRNLAFVLANQAMNFVEAGDHVVAKKKAREAVDIVESLYKPGHPLITQMYLRLGYIFGTTDQEEEFNWYQHALSLINEETAPFIKIRTLENIGTNLYQRELYEDAFKYLDQAEHLMLADPTDSTKTKTYDKIDDKALLFWILWGKAYSFRGLAKSGKAKEANLHSAKTYYESVISLVNLIFGKLRYEASRKELLSSHLREVYEEAIEVCTELHKINPDPALLTRAFELAETRKSTYLLESIRNTDKQRFAGIPSEVTMLEKELLTELGEVEGKLSSSTSNTSGKDSQDHKDLLAQQIVLTGRYDSLVRIIERDYPNYFQLKYTQEPISIEDLQRKLAPRTLLLEYYEGKETYFLFSIGKDSYEVHSLDKSPETDSLLSVFLAESGNKEKVENLGAGKEAVSNYTSKAMALYKVFLKEVLEKEENEDITSLIIVPDGKLSYLPFGLLLREEPATLEANNWRELPYLFRKYRIQYAYSASVRYTEGVKKNSAKKKFAGFAPQYSSQLFAKSRDLEFMYNQREIGDLKFSREEVAEIASYYKGKTYLEAEANEGSFKAEAAEYKVLHLAMHAFVNDDEAMSSGLLFSSPEDSTEDGFLHAYEIYDLDLKADLVILSACNTGQGTFQEGEGVISLGRAFAYAGCPNIMMSLWQADDGTTRNLMQNYHRFLSEGAGKVEALHLARNAYLANSDLTHPYYWGSFVLIGDDAPVLYPISPWLFVLLVLVLGLAGGMFWWVSRPPLTT